MYVIGISLLTLCTEEASPPRAVITSRSCFLVYVCPVIMKQLKHTSLSNYFGKNIKFTFGNLPFESLSDPIVQPTMS